MQSDRDSSGGGQVYHESLPSNTSTLSSLPHKVGTLTSTGGSSGGGDPYLPMGGGVGRMDSMRSVTSINNNINLDTESASSSD